MNSPLSNESPPDGAATAPARATAAAPAGVNSEANRRKTRRTLLAVLAVCIAPVIASYAAYYWLPPSGRTNYGDLVQPPRDVAAVPILPVVVPAAIPGERVLPVTTQGPAGLGGFGGRWVMVVVAPAACDASCADQLYKIRQVRLTTGKNRNRVERLWLIPASGLAASATPNPQILSEHEGTWVAEVGNDELVSNFPAGAHGPTAHIFLIDPLSKLMMRFPVDADPNRMKKDLNKLLKASRIG
ncbi:MAG: cytochrome C oxidase subunit I [Burkholderiaceae bacterium]